MECARCGVDRENAFAVYGLIEVHGEEGARLQFLCAACNRSLKSWWTGETICMRKGDRIVIDPSKIEVEEG